MDDGDLVELLIGMLAGREEYPVGETEESLFGITKDEDGTVVGGIVLAVEGTVGDMNDVGDPVLAFDGVPVGLNKYAPVVEL